MCSVQAHLKVHLSCRPLLPLADRNASSRRRRKNSPPKLCFFCHNFPFMPLFLASFTDAGKMSSAHDRAVLQAIFNPTTPFGSNSGPNQEEELCDDGECAAVTWGVSLYHVTAFSCLSFRCTFKKYLKTSHSCTNKDGKKNTWHFNPSWFPGDISVFSLPRYLSIEFECLFNLFISFRQTAALTRSCWSKWKSWSCRVSRRQRLGICKVHFSCSARQSRSCLGVLRPTTTGHRPWGCGGTQQVPATNSIRDLACRHLLSSGSPAWHHIRCTAIGLTYTDCESSTLSVPSLQPVIALAGWDILNRQNTWISAVSGCRKCLETRKCVWGSVEYTS